MNCPDEFFLSQYADGELAENETGWMAVHLESCPVCRRQVMELQAENQLLRATLHDTELWETDRETARQRVPGIGWFGLAVAGLLSVSFLLRTCFGFISNSELPAGLDWLHPLSLSGMMNLLVNALFYLLEKGRNIMTTLTNEVSSILLGLLLLSAFVALVRRTRRMASAICLASMLLFLIVPAHAIEIRKAEKDVGNISVAEDETIDDTLVAFGDSVDIRGIVTGDLITFARRVNIQGSVEGNLITFGQNIDVTGKVDGDLIGFAQSMQAGGDIGKNLWVFAQTLTMGQNGRIGQNATAFGANVNVDGSIGQDASIFGAFLDVGGNVGRDLNVSGERLSVKGTTVVGRNLNATIKLEKNLQIAPGATIQGMTNIIPAPEKVQANKFVTFGFYFGQFLRIAAAFVMGVLLFWIIPGMKKVPLTDMRGLLSSGGIGFLAAVATPIAAVILIITLIGLPVGVTLLLFWLLVLYYAKILVGRCIGNMLLKEKKNTLGEAALSLLIGLVIVIVAVNIPYIGFVLNILLTILGMGAFLISFWRLFRKKAPEELPEVSAS